MSAHRPIVVTTTHTARICRIMPGINATTRISAASQANQAPSTKRPTCSSIKSDTYRPQNPNWRSKSYRKSMKSKRVKWVLLAASRAVRVNQRWKRSKNRQTLSWRWYRHRRSSSRNSLLRKRFKSTVSLQARTSQPRQTAQPPQMHPKGWRLLTIRKSVQWSRPVFLTTLLCKRPNRQTYWARKHWWKRSPTKSGILPPKLHLWKRPRKPKSSYLHKNRAINSRNKSWIKPSIKS